MARPRRELAIAHGAQLPAQRLLGDGDAEFLEHPLAEIDIRQRTTPWTAGIGPLSIIRPSACAVRVIEPGGLSRRLAVDAGRRGRSR